MLRYSFVLLVAVFVFIFSGGECRRDDDLDATLEYLSPRGLKISLITLPGPPTNIQVSDITATSVRLTWTYPSEDLQYLYYVISYKPKYANQAFSEISGIITMLYTVHSLSPYTEYEMYVIAVNNIGRGPPSAPVIVTTGETESNTQSNCIDQPTPRPPPRPTPEVIITDNTPEQDGCTFLSPTIRNGGVKACRGEVLFKKRFNNLDGFSHQIHIGGSEPSDEFTVFTKDNAVSYTDNGNLTIRPKLLEDAYSEEFVRTGTLNLDGCTSTVPNQCYKTGATYVILPPVMGARLTSKGSFSFCYGILEIRAKLPRGDWIVPELWLEPLSGAGTRAGRVVLAMSRGNVNSNRELEAGVIVASGPQMGRKVHNASWSQDFHTFKLVWTKDNMQFYVDGDLITRLPQGAGAIEPSLGNGQVAPFDKEYYITLGLHVAGRMDFPDDMPNKPWKNSNPKRFVTFWEAKDSWKASWDQDAALKVEYIKVTAL